MIASTSSNLTARPSPLRPPSFATPVEEAAALADPARELAAFFVDLLDTDDDGERAISERAFAAAASGVFGKAAATTLFLRADRDRDGALCAGEVERDLRRGDGVFAELFRRLMDFDGDGAVTRGAFRLGTYGRVEEGRAARVWAWLDPLGAGRLGPRDLRAAFADLRDDGGVASPFAADRLRLGRPAAAA